MFRLKKPYTAKDKSDFIVEHNHRNGRKIEETNDYLYALEPNEIIQDGEVIINPNYEAEQAEIAKQERIEEIKQELDELDRKRIRAICEPSQRTDGQSWLEYYNEKILELREKMEGLNYGE